MRCEWTWLGVLVLAPAIVSLSCAAEPTVLRDNRLNPALLTLEANKWVQLHQQRPGDRVRFHRQEHGGSCFDIRRGQLILFGSNTHGRDWTNSPLVFDPVSLEWTRLYPDDDRSTYRVNDGGLPVAGEKGDHPWAMHTFGSVVYDPERDQMVVCSYPAHMVPGRFSNALQHLWDKVKKQPTWTFDLEKKEWVPLACEPVHFFPHCAVYDSDRKVVVGYRPDGIYELAGEPRSWRKVVEGGFFGWHTNAVYDSRNKAVLVFGSNENRNDVVVYRPETKEHRKMPTPGARPPKDQHNPMCFDPETGKLVIVVDRILEPDERNPKKQAETWLYDLGQDVWMQLPEATLPFGCGMNYNMEYGPLHKVCLLVAAAPSDFGNATTVFALRVDLSKLEDD